jgi:hypothetical protein
MLGGRSVDGLGDDAGSIVFDYEDVGGVLVFFFGYEWKAASMPTVASTMEGRGGKSSNRQVRIVNVRRARDKALRAKKMMETLLFPSKEPPGR